MKKIISCVLSLLGLAVMANAQVLPSEQMKNTAWTGLGCPIDGDIMFYGFTDTFQSRFDRGKFTVEAMLNWSFLFGGAFFGVFCWFSLLVSHEIIIAHFRKKHKRYRIGVGG